ncbi:MAG: cytochrome C peroxidase [candidate division NC10 bacterium]|nr:cytochrome C peroxidase [candidate division NC10 bacterium]
MQAVKPIARQEDQEMNPHWTANRTGPRGRGRRAAGTLLLAVGLAGAMLAPGPTWAANPAAPPSLKTIPVPQPPNLSQFVKNHAAAIRLGKALFWDMQVGSDGVQACASCHFHAGADRRFKNVVSPGLLGGDTTFQVVDPNGTLSAAMFPFSQFVDPNDRTTAIIRDWNDVVSSPGVYNTTYVGQPLQGAVEQGIPVPDPTGFSVHGVNVRRVEPRNTPSVINAVFNFANFWDGRANSTFNGENPFGDADPNAGVWVNAGGLVSKVRVRIPLASLASQAVGPPGSDFEMSFAGRTFPEIGKKLLNPRIVPLGKQLVHPRDSVLGSLAKSGIDRRGRVSRGNGLNTMYAAMVEAAFHDQYWNYGGSITLPQGTYTQTEANFALFFGLAIQLYEATLVSDDTPFDRFQEGDASAMSPSAQEGLNIFLGFNDPGGVGGNCIACHSTATFSNASVMHIGETNFGASLPEGLIERMIMGDLGGAWYDSGFYNIGVRPTGEDLGRGGTDPFGNPLSFIDRALLAFNGQSGQLSYDPFATDPPGVLLLPCGANDPFGRVCPSDQRVATRGAFKTPGLRNVELTGPYMHNGGEATLMQVMDFYGRGGNFFEANLAEVDADIQPLFGLNPNPILQPGNLANPNGGAVAEANQKKVIDFMLALTDERVRWEQAPFDHPSLAVPNGARVLRHRASDEMLVLPAVGADGRAAQGLPPLGTFLNLSPYQP